MARAIPLVTFETAVGQAEPKRSFPPGECSARTGLPALAPRPMADAADSGMVLRPAAAPECCLRCQPLCKPFWRHGLMALLVWSSLSPTELCSATTSVTNLPPPAAMRVDYARDIRPLLERSCFRCHATERPKSGFRLNDREAALEGGYIGVPIVVSNSAASPLIHYVARAPEVDADLWMPPEGKTPILTAEEVGLLRAWIDQGAYWDSGPEPPAWSFEAAPTVGWTTVSGDERLFREHHWMPDGWNGGLEQLDFWQRVDDRTRVTLEGRLLRDDYRLKLRLERRDLGFLGVGVEQFRKYYSDSGGYYQGFAPGQFSLDRDLHVDRGRSWVDVGLTLPHWPRLTLGYEHQYREGDQALTSWSPVTQSGVTRNLYPNARHVDEDTHLFKFKLDHEMFGVRIEDDFQAEWSRWKSGQTNTVRYPPEADTLLLDHVQQAVNHFQAANALRLEKQFKPWLFGSGGYLYSHFDADGSFSLDESLVGGTPLVSRRWQSPGITLERDAHVGNVNGQIGPWNGFIASAGVQGEWNRQRGFGQASFDLDLGGGGLILQPTAQHTAIDRGTLTEHVGLRYAKLPFTALFAEGRFQQERIGQFEEQPGGEFPLRRDTDADREVRDGRLGFHTSPWPRLSLAGHVRRMAKRISYDHALDVVPTPAGGFPAEGYSAFIRGQEVETDELEARISYRWASWLKTAFFYRLVATDTRTAMDPVAGLDPVTFVRLPGYLTPGTRQLSGNYDAHVYSVNAVVRPLRRLTFNTTFSLHDARTASAANDHPGLAAYRGRTYSVLYRGTYAWNDRTELSSSYAFSHANYGQEQWREGLPVGIEYSQHRYLAGLRRRLTDHIALTLRYGLFLYDEPGAGNMRDYTAHLVFATCSIRVP